MYSITDLKIGTKITLKDKPFQVISCQHSKIGRGGAILRSKLKNLINGTVIEKTFTGAEKIQEADLSFRKNQYLYKENDQYFFMDSKTFEQFDLESGQLGKNASFLKEGQDVDIMYYENQPINIQLPIKTKFKITYTEPGFKGNTASAGTKPATIETNAQIQVPLFIKIGDEVIVDTRTGEYVERA